MAVTKPVEEKSLPAAKEKMPAGGNNNFLRKLKNEKIWPCVDAITQLTPYQKRLFSKYPEELVKRATHYAYVLYAFDGPDDPSARASREMKLALCFCANSEQYQEDYEKRMNPKPKQSKAERIQAANDAKHDIAIKQNDQYKQFAIDLFGGEAHYQFYKGWKIDIHAVGITFKNSKTFKSITALFCQDNFEEFLHKMKRDLDA